MSYVFKIVKDEEGIRLDIADSMLKYVPAGAFVVNGHHVPEGEKGSESLSISLSATDGRHVSAYMGASR